MSMTHSEPAQVDGKVLRWAIERADTSAVDLARSVGTSEAVVEQWIEGLRKPSFRQARAAASYLRVPFGFLFLPEPPPEKLPIPDFRRVHGEPIGAISPDLRDVILATLRRQSWLSEYRREQGADPVVVVGRAGGATAYTEIAADIRRALDLESVVERPPNADDFLRLLVTRAEEVGVNVLRSGIVGNNTHRALDVDEFRGFALSDEFAPFIFINGADAKPAQTFTLIHELAHIWLGQSGISGAVGSAEDLAETLCNRIAAEVLVPTAEFLQHWPGGADAADAIQRIARQFRISRFVVAIKAFETGLISKERLEELLAEYRAERWAQTRREGGDFYRTTITRNGRQFTDSVISALSRQQVLTFEAARLLEIKPARLDRLAKELRGGE